jgi:hypothetical protein
MIESLIERAICVCITLACKDVPHEKALDLAYELADEIWPVLPEFEREEFYLRLKECKDAKKSATGRRLLARYSKGNNWEITTSIQIDGVENRKTFRAFRCGYHYYTSLGAVLPYHIIVDKRNVT